MEPFIQTDELIDLYSADPITGRAKYEDNSDEDFIESNYILATNIDRF